MTVIGFTIGWLMFGAIVQPLSACASGSLTPGDRFMRILGGAISGALAYGLWMLP